MDTNAQHQDELLKQIRVAHRLLAAYYQRLHPALLTIAQKLELDGDFFEWWPHRFDRPAQSTSNVFNKSAWDLLPGNCTHYKFFKKIEEKKGVFKFGSIYLEFFVVSDTGILVDNLKSKKPHMADGLKLDLRPESAESWLRIKMLTPAKENIEYSLWHSQRNSSPAPLIGTGNGKAFIDEQNQCAEILLDVSIARLFDEDSLSELCDQAAECRAAVLAYADTVNSSGSSEALS